MKESAVLEVLIRSIVIEIFQPTPQTRWCFVSVGTSTGHVGVGEATLQRHEADVLSFADTYFPTLIGRSADPSSADTRHDKPLVQSAVTSAMSQALWDAKAKIEGRSLTELLGGAPSGLVKVYANINRRTIDRTPDGFERSAKAAFEKGHRAFKIAPFDEVLRGATDEQPETSLVNGIERIAAVRQTIGPQCDLMVDCHWRLTPKLTEKVIKQSAPFDLHWIECPLAETAENLAELARLRGVANSQGILLAGCELCVGVDGFEQFLAADAYDVVMPDIKYIGSIEDMSRLWEVLSAKGVRMSPHNPSGPVSHAATLHLCNALSSDIRMEMQFDETPLFWSLAPTVPQPVDGKSPLPLGNGLGSDLSPEVMKEGRVFRRGYA